MNIIRAALRWKADVIHVQEFPLSVAALAASRACQYEEFRQRLIAGIGDWKQKYAAVQDAVYRYYERWLESLERLVVERGLLTEEEIQRRAEHLHDSDHHY